MVMSGCAVELIPTTSSLGIFDLKGARVGFRNLRSAAAAAFPGRGCQLLVMRIRGGGGLTRARSSRILAGSCRLFLGGVPVGNKINGRPAGRRTIARYFPQGKDQGKFGRSK